MNSRLVMTAVACLVVAACTKTPPPLAEDGVTETPKPGATDLAANPLLEDWDTPFGVPPFDQIESQDYLPALRAGMQAHAAEIDAIAANAEAPSFENTIESLERFRTWVIPSAMNRSATYSNKTASNPHLPGSEKRLGRPSFKLIGKC